MPAVAALVGPGSDLLAQLGGVGIDVNFEEVSPEIVHLVMAVLLGMFLGLEREWSHKDAGIRTFALISLLGAIFTIIGDQLLLVAGATLVIAMSVLLAVQSLIARDAEAGLSLTTSASMFVAYGVGVLVASGYVTESVIVAVLSSLLLVLKRELHEFAWGLSREEMRSATEFSILAFVIYPLLPHEAFGPWNAIDARTIWLLVIAVSAIGLVNYVMVKRYEGRGLAATGFFGGLVNSTAVIAEMAQRAATDASLRNLAVGAILIANAAMAVRNAIIVIPFVPRAAFIVGIPLGAIAVTGLVLSLYVSDWNQDLETNLTSPFSLRNALVFGGLFLIILLAAAGAEATFGSSGFLVTTFIAGMVSSGSATATAVTLVGTNQITAELAVAGVLAGTLSSILVKVVFAAAIDRDLVKPVLLWNLVLIATGLLAALAVIDTI